MKCYLSGWHSSRRHRELEVIQAGALKHRCFAFATIQKIHHKKFSVFTYAPWQQAVYDLNVDSGIGIMMDSSAVAFRHIVSRTGEELSERILFDPYVEWCRREAKKWDLYFTLDLEVSSPFIYKMQKRLFKLGLNPVPVYHGDASTDYLRRYVDMGSTLIGIGSPPELRTSLKAKRRFLDSCFNAAEKWNFKIHGLAMTAVWQMLNYPFASVDSSSWTRCATVGCLMKFDPQSQRVTILHVSDRDSSKAVKMSTETRQRLERELSDEGWDYQKLHTDLVARHCYNAATMQQIAEFAEKRKTGSFDLLWS